MAKVIWDALMMNPYFGKSALPVSLLGLCCQKLMEIFSLDELKQMLFKDLYVACIRYRKFHLR